MSNSFVVTVIGPSLPAASSIEHLLTSLGLTTGRSSLGLSGRSISFEAKSPKSADEKSLRALLRAHPVAGYDIAVQTGARFATPKGLLVMDMDSTLIEIEVIDELAKLAGVGDQVTAITAEAMAGNIDFDESLKRRVALLKGLPERAMKKLAGRLPLTPGAEELVARLQQKGVKIALISGGFSYFGRVLQQKLKLDYLETNELELVGGRLTGRVTGKIVNGKRKAEFLLETTAALGLSARETVAVGDGANDIPMLQASGLGVAFNAKPRTREAADVAINCARDLSLVLALSKDWAE